MKIAEFKITEHKFDTFLGIDKYTYCYYGAFDTIAEMLQFIKENKADGAEITVIGIASIDYECGIFDNNNISFDIMDSFYKRLMVCPTCI